MISAFFYTIKQAFVQVFRNKNMSTASVFSITAMMLILGLFFIIAVNVNLIATGAQEQFDSIQVYLLDETSEAEAMQMLERIERIDGVEEVTYISKEDAMLEMKDRWGEEAYLLDGLVDNPFPASLMITSSDLMLEDEIVAQVKKMDGIEDIKYHQDVINKILTITGYIQTGALILIAILIVVSIIVVSNTIKLTVHARSREINIMKYVGATNWFIRGPFLVEGMLIGLFSSLIGAGIIGAAYYKFADVFQEKLLILFSNGMVPFDFVMENLLIIFVAIGISIGSLGSILSMRRFLDT